MSVFYITCEMKPSCSHGSNRQLEALSCAEAFRKAEELGWWLQTTQALCPKCRMERLARTMGGPSAPLKLGLGKRD